MVTHELMSNVDAWGVIASSNTCHLDMGLNHDTTFSKLWEIDFKFSILYYVTMSLCKPLFKWF